MIGFEPACRESSSAREALESSAKRSTEKSQQMIYMKKI